MAQPTISRFGSLSIQVCVPEDWTDQQAIDFAEKQCPCGTTNGWGVRTDPKKLAGSPYRNPCARENDNVHITLDA